MGRLFENTERLIVVSWPAKPATSFEPLSIPVRCKGQSVLQGRWDLAMANPMVASGPIPAERRGRTAVIFVPRRATRPDK